MNAHISTRLHPNQACVLTSVSTQTTSTRPGHSQTSAHINHSFLQVLTLPLTHLPPLLPHPIDAYQTCGSLAVFLARTPPPQRCPSQVTAAQHSQTPDPDAAPIRTTKRRAPPAPRTGPARASECADWSGSQLDSEPDYLPSPEYSQPTAVKEEKGRNGQKRKRGHCDEEVEKQQRRRGKKRASPTAQQRSLTRSNLAALQGEPLAVVPKSLEEVRLVLAYGGYTSLIRSMLIDALVANSVRTGSPFACRAPHEEDVAVEPASANVEEVAWADGVGLIAKRAGEQWELTRAAVRMQPNPQRHIQCPRVHLRQAPHVYTSSRLHGPITLCPL